MTEHPGEQFPPDVDPDVEPGFDPYPAEETPETPDYDAEPSPQSFSDAEKSEVAPDMGQYDEDGAGKADTEAAFAASVDEPATHADPAEVAHVDPAEVEFGPEFARAPGEEHEHSFAAESPAAEPEADTPAEHVVPEYPVADDVPDEERGHPLVEETMGRLDELRDRPVGEHADVYADLHERLQSALVEADAEPGDRG